MKHTQGKWEVSEDSDFVTATNGDIVCQFFTKDEGGMINKEANAKLIAAAPELLEALILAKEHIKSNWDNSDGEIDLGILHDAIKKATL